MTIAFRAALIRKIEKEIDRVDQAPWGDVREDDGPYDSYQDGFVHGQLQGLYYALLLAGGLDD